MGEQHSWWTTFGAGLVLAAGSLSTGCGRYEPEAEYPARYVAPALPTAEEQAAQEAARREAVGESREILIGAEGDAEYPDTDPSALTEFKPALDGHGAWVDDATYGTVWVPASAEVGTDFQPYVTAGHWTYSDSTDYVWVSDYSWGWAPFHYGRWVQLPGHGWSWIPGRRYAGAWVTWRVGPAGYGYVGWAPAAPDWYWYHGTPVGWSFGWYHPYDHYVYCPRSYVYDGAVHSHVVRGPAAREHYGRTHDYAPSAPERVVANPTVGGGRVVADPSVGGGERVVANSQVGGGERIAANPAVGGLADANPTAGATQRLAGARGPRPDELGVEKNAVLAPPSGNAGLSRAQAFAAPSTAVAAGAAAPAYLSRPAARFDAPSPLSRQPASSSFIPDRGANPSFRSSPSAVSASPSFGSMPSASSSPSFRSSPSVSSSPSFRSSSPSVSSSPSFRSSSPSVSSSPSFRSSPSVSSSPSFRSSPSSSPSFRSSPSVTPSFRSSPSSSPSFRSSPSVTPSFRSSPSSSPSFRSSPSVTPSFRSSPSSSPPSRSSGSSIRSTGGSLRRK